MHEQALEPLVRASPEDLPPLVERDLDDLRPEPRDGGDLRLRSRVRDHDRAAKAEAPGPPGDSLRHVAGACRPDSACELLRGSERQGVARASQLEGADRLQVLELQIELGGRVGDFEPDERRAEDCAREALACGLDLRERDQSATSGSRPRVSRPSIGSCALQLPKPTKSSCLTWAICSGPDRALPPAEGVGAHREGGFILLGQRLLLVAVEDGRREQVEKAVLVAGANRVVEPGRRLERHAQPAAGGDEPGKVGNSRRGRAAATHLRPDAELAELEDPERHVVAQRQLAVDLRRGVDHHLGIDPRGLDRLDPLVGLREPALVEDDGEPERLVTELRELRGGADEAVDDPAGVAVADAPVLGQPFGERQLSRRKGRSVVDQSREQRAASVDCRPGKSHGCERKSDPAGRA